MLDHRNYKLHLWERETNEDYTTVDYDQPDYYLNEEESFCILSFKQKILDKNWSDVLGVEERKVEIYFDIKEEVIEFVENLLIKLKDNLINPENYKLEN